jgi:hypothetical protein
MEGFEFLAGGYVIFKLAVGIYLIRLWNRSRRARREAAAARQVA